MADCLIRTAAKKTGDGTQDELKAAKKLKRKAEVERDDAERDLEKARKIDLPGLEEKAKRAAERAAKAEADLENARNEVEDVRSRLQELRSALERMKKECEDRFSEVDRMLVVPMTGAESGFGFE